MAIKKYHVSKNLFDEVYPNLGTTIRYKAIEVGNGDFTLSSNIPVTSGTAQLFLLSGNVSSGASTATNGVYNGRNRTVTSANGYVTIAYVHYSTHADITNYNVMLNTGETAEPYEPYDTEVWHTIPYRKYGTETDTITTLPKSIIADGQSASANIIGNMNQQGTPSPSSIIMPDECGNKTANLLDTTGSVNGYINASGEFTTPHANLYTTDYLPIPTGASSITQSYNLGDQMLTPAMCFYDSSKTFISGESFQYSASKTFQVPANAVYFRTCYRTTFSWCMVNTGSTALPYQPYGYKIPISSGGTTTPVYLGEVQSTRKIKKLVLTGEEQFLPHQTIASWFQLFLSDIVIDNLELCTHYKLSPYNPADMQNGEILVRKQTSADNGRIIIKDTAYTTTADFKAYLAAQYANGTPVTVWYVLATPTTDIVNEPIRKIGNYSDSVSVSNIPTTGTAEQFDVDTELKPSEVSLTYHGWHEHSDTKF